MNANLFRALTAVIGRTPLPMGYLLADLLTPLHYYGFPRRRRALLANLAVALPDAESRSHRQTARSITRNYNRMLFEFFRLPRMTAADLSDCIDIVGMEHIDAACRSGRGVIVTSCHIGNWELGAVALARRGHPVTAVAGVQFGRWLGADVRAAKEQLAVSTVSPEDGFRKLWRALARNEVVALMVDGDIFSSSSKQDFLGRPTPWPAGPGMLSERTGAPIVPGICERIGAGKFRIRFEAPLTASTGAALNAQVAAATSHHVRAHLDQWCIFRAFWPHEGVDAAPAADGAQAQARVRA